MSDLERAVATIREHIDREVRGEPATDQERKAVLRSFVTAARERGVDPERLLLQARSEAERQTNLHDAAKTFFAEAGGNLGKPVGTPVEEIARRFGVDTEELARLIDRTIEGLE